MKVLAIDNNKNWVMGKLRAQDNKKDEGSKSLCQLNHYKKKYLMLLLRKYDRSS
jgi:hypothetical protein